MRRKQLALRLIVPVLLVGLVGWLAALEYRWLDQVSQADREQRRAWLGQHASEFADDVDREIARLYGFLQTASDSVQLGPDPAFATAYASWHDTAADPQILRSIYWAKDAGQGPTLAQFDPTTQRFRTVPWPDALASLRTRVRPASPTEDLGFVSAPGALVPLAFMHDTVDAAIPAVIVARASVSRLEPARTQTVVAVSTSTEVLIGLLDRPYLEGTWLPALADRHFPAHSVDPYRVAVVDVRTPLQPLMTYNWPGGTSIDLGHPDATEPLFALRPELTARMIAAPFLAKRATGGQITQAGEGTGPSDRAAGSGTRSSQATFRLVVQTDRTGPAPSLNSATRVFGRPAGGWQLLVQHASGSLDLAVTQARHRNLWLSFGLLAVLSAGIVLIVTNAQRSERLATQQMEFVATVSHELRTPLAVIRSAAQNLGAGLIADPARAQQYGELIEAEGRRLTDMVEQVLDFAGLTGATRAQPSTPVDIGAIATEVLAACQPLAAAAHVEVESAIAAPLPAVLGDERAIHSAIQNLVVNALKYGADGHWLRVDVRVVDRRGAAVEVTVADHGMGIDVEDRRHLFEPFYRGRRALAAQVHGNGLGLSLVKRIAEAHGGQVRVDSAPGAGATFRLTLPAVRATAEAPELTALGPDAATD